MPALAPRIDPHHRRTAARQCTSYRNYRRFTQLVHRGQTKTGTTVLVLTNFNRTVLRVISNFFLHRSIVKSALNENSRARKRFSTLINRLVYHWRIIWFTSHHLLTEEGKSYRFAPPCNASTSGGKAGQVVPSRTSPSLLKRGGRGVSSNRKRPRFTRPFRNPHCIAGARITITRTPRTIAL